MRPLVILFTSIVIAACSTRASLRTEKGLMTIHPHHVALSVANLETMVAWYRSALGFQEALRFDVGRTGGKAVMLERDGFRIELFWMPDSIATGDPPLDPVAALARLGFTHFGFAVDDVRRTYEELRARGIAFVVPPTEYVKGVLVAFFRDPEGNLFELLPNPHP
jgi:4-hydroxymandelate synthase